MTFTARTFSKTLKREIKAAYPEAASCTKRHVPGIGYVLYVKDAAGAKVCNVLRGSCGFMVAA